MPPLLDQRLLVVSGKGGVGKSTVAAALVNIKRCRLREEIEFILDESINSKELNFMQKAIPFEFKQQYIRQVITIYPLHINIPIHA